MTKHLSFSDSNGEPIISSQEFYAQGYQAAIDSVAKYLKKLGCETCEKGESVPRCYECVRLEHWEIKSTY